MNRPSFLCEAPADLQAPEQFLQEALLQKEIFPVCTITGPLLDAAIQETTTVGAENFSRNGHFLEADFEPASKEVASITAMMHRLALVGLAVSKKELQHPRTRIFQADDAGIHVDLGFGNIVNLTIDGERDTTHYNQQLQNPHSEHLRAGDLSIVPSHAAPYYLQTLPHQVQQTTSSGLVLQCSTAFPLRDQRAGLPA